MMRGHDVRAAGVEAAAGRRVCWRSVRRRGPPREPVPGPAWAHGDRGHQALGVGVLRRGVRALLRGEIFWRARSASPGDNVSSLTKMKEAGQDRRARIVRHGRYVVFQLAEVAVPRAVFAETLRRIDRLRPRPLLK